VKQEIYPPMQLLYRTLLCAVLLCLLLAAPASLRAQEEKAGQVQVINGRIEQGEVMFYVLPDLQQDDTLYAYIQHESGNLDPALLLATPDMITENLLQDLRAEMNSLVSAGTDPTEAMAQVLLSFFLTGDDNGGQDSAATIEFSIPEDGDYLLLALGTPVNDTFGDYELIVGINEPLVASGKGQPTGDEIAFLDKESSGIATAVRKSAPS